MAKEWFEDWFDTKYYHILYKNRNYNEAENFIDNLLNYLKPNTTAKFIDIACGKGRHSIFINKKGFPVVGYDLSKESIASADESAKKEVYYWIKMFVAAVGWHYPLDLIWQYNRIKALNLPKGATILDAGAGYGMMQYILAGNGYNVISVDFLRRKKPFLQSYIFRISNDDHIIYGGPKGRRVKIYK